MSKVQHNTGLYSYVAIEIQDMDEEGQPRPVDDVLDDAIKAAKKLHEEFDDEQPEPPQQEQQRHEPSPPGPDGDPGPQNQYGDHDGPQMRERAPVQENPRYGAGSGVETKEQMLARCWGTCPDCGHDSKPSILKYQKWDTTDDGIEVPGKHYCSNESCPRKGGTIWRRELTPIPPF